MNLLPLRLTGAVFTRFSAPPATSEKSRVLTLRPVSGTDSDFEAMLREETRQRAARLCLYGNRSRPEPKAGGK